MNLTPEQQLAQMKAQYERDVAAAVERANPPIKPMQAFVWDLKAQSGFGYSQAYVDALRRWQSEESELQNETVTEMIRRVEVLID